jgi:putative heme-binding domain-containing protein
VSLWFHNFFEKPTTFFGKLILAICFSPGRFIVSKSRLLLVFTLLLISVGLVWLIPADAQGPKEGKAKKAPQWIWLGSKAEPNQTVYFRKVIPVPRRVVSAKIYGACDNQMSIYINGKEVISSNSWETPIFREVTELFRNPTKVDDDVLNVLAVKAHNTEGQAGLLVRLILEFSNQTSMTVVTDNTWRGSTKAEKGWNEVDFKDAAWTQAAVVGKLGAPPWAKITEASLSGVAKFIKPSATPIELIKVKKDFKVELLYSVPKDKQGSWVSLCIDPKGRLITSDQYGKLYRVTPPTLNSEAQETKVEELPVDLGEAHGLLWAFDSLYVVVNRGKKYESGLWRVRSSQNNDILDTKEKLRDIQGGGEHGPHAVLLSPDGKSLYVMCGNHTKLTTLSRSLVPQVWGEDYLVPRQWDASGHAVGIYAPGGYICRVDPDGKNWDLVSIGYRNQYDAAFNRDGELFTYDSDMEWDMNLPWYKPTRVCHAVDGSEFGWRSGTSNFPHYYPDNLPPALDVGPGSPTGVAFGYGAKFPTKYQNALFLCDWSYGKLYAAHLKPQGATYTGELEEFMNGSPLPLTDLVVNPKDGALYFTIGGRNTMSGLYRVTYVGKESTEPAPADNAEAEQRTLRKKLESFYAKKDPNAVDIAWPYLHSEDRFLRYAARTVLEFQDLSLWQEKALKETNPVTLTHALVGLTRVGDKALLPRILEALERLDWAKLDTSQKIDMLRAYQLAFIRMGPPDAAGKERAGKRLDAFYPADHRDVTSELAKLVSYLETPQGVAKTLALIAKAPTQEEQIDYAFALRTVKSGWTKNQHEEYFNWFHQAAGYRGGNSFHGFLRNIRNDAVKILGPQELTELKPALDKVPQPTAPQFAFKKRDFVKKWTVDELLPIVEKGLTNRNFDRGRNLFGETKCFACHRFNNEGGGTGPDLTIVSGRFGPRDLLEAIIEPSKVISDQYQSIVVVTTDGRVIQGRIVNLAGDSININTDMLDPNKLVGVNRNLIEAIEPSKVSMMPDNLLDTLNQDEILDLAAYLYSRGDRNHKMFRRE